MLALNLSLSLNFYSSASGFINPAPESFFEASWTLLLSSPPSSNISYSSSSCLKGLSSTVLLKFVNEPPSLSLPSPPLSLSALILFSLYAVAVYISTIWLPNILFARPFEIFFKVIAVPVGFSPASCAFSCYFNSVRSSSSSWKFSMSLARSKQHLPKK